MYYVYHTLVGFYSPITNQKADQKMLVTKIETERLILRELVEDNASELFGIFSDHEVMKYWNSGPWGSIDEALTFITHE